MSENQNGDKKTAVCPVCGAEVSNRRIYCPECGANVKSGAPRAKSTAKTSKKPPVPADAQSPTVVDAARSETRFDDAPQAEAIEQVATAAESDGGGADVSPHDDLGADYFDTKPNGEPLDFGAAVGPYDETADGKNRCKKCGAEVPLGARFCGACGALQDRRCIRCGEPLSPDARFCKKCGAAQDGSTAATANVAATARPSAEDLRRKSLNTVSIIWLTLGMVIGVMFMIADFLRVNIYTPDGEHISFAQDGLALFGVLFGGRSTLTAIGVPIELLRFAGWLYLAVALTFVAAVVCFVLNGKRNSKAAPFGMLATSAVYFAIGIATLVVTLVARSFVDPLTFADGSNILFFMGGAGVFAGSAVAFVGSLIVFVISRKAFPEKCDKRLRIGYHAGLGGLVAVIAALACVPALVGYSEKTVAPGGSGRATVRIAETLDDTMFGAEVIRLDGLEYGAEYTFSIRTDEYIDAEFMEDCLMLCRYSDVTGKSVLEIALYAEAIETNQTRGASTAKLRFVYEGDDPLAIVVSFAASTRTSVGFKYELE